MKNILQYKFIKIILKIQKKIIKIVLEKIIKKIIGKKLFYKIIGRNVSTLSSENFLTWWLDYKKLNKLDLDLELMINDLTESHNFNNYSPYWNDLAQNHIKLLNENGIENFKQTIERVHYWGEGNIRSKLLNPIWDDEIIISTMEHHSNIVPWQMACKKKKAKLIVAPINNQGELLLDKLKEKVNNRTKLISITHISNTLGTINPIEKIIAFAKSKGIAVLIDAAQSVAHMKIDVKELDCDFLVFSGHKLFGPTGTGVLYAKKKWLDQMPSYQGGGDMIKEVSFEKTTYNDPPHKFEAGTPNISGVIGLATAIEYVQNLGFKFIQQQEQDLLSFATNEMNKIDEIEIIGTASNKASVISFLVKGTHPFDVGTILDQLGVAIRTGHHCTQPLMNFYNIPGTARVSFSFYNTIDEMKYFIKALKKVISMLN